MRLWRSYYISQSICCLLFIAYFLVYFTCLFILFFSSILTILYFVPNFGYYFGRYMLSDSEEQELKDLLFRASNPSSAAMIIISLLFRIVILLKKEV